jgi:hypothetical protein
VRAIYVEHQVIGARTNNRLPCRSDILSFHTPVYEGMSGSQMA